MSKITAVIIAKNEDERIGRCLNSLAFCDEILVIDNDSTDKTVEIAKKHGAKVHTFSSSDYSAARNYGLKHTKTPWILYVDADEEVSKQLAQEIVTVITEGSSFSAYRLRRKNFYLGSNPWPKIEQLERLFLRDKLIRWEGELHESPTISGEIGVLQGFLFHYTHRTISEMVAKTLIWSDVEAKLRYDAGHPEVVWWRFPRVMLSAFFNSYIEQGGWRVGVVGLIESIYQSFSSFITYAKLWELQHSGGRKHAKES